jgi:hypothetical protein
MVRARGFSLMVGLFVGTLTACASHDSPVPAVDAADAAADTPGFDVTEDVVDYPDTPAGRVARHLVGCQGIESGCHGSEPAPAGLRFGRGPAADLASLINVPSTERPDWMRIAPHDAAHSWVIAKLRNLTDAGVTTAMPRGSSGDPAFAAIVEEWIDAGAPNEFMVGGDASLVDAD